MDVVLFDGCRINYFNLVQKKAPWSLGSFSKQIRFILSKPHLNFIYKFIYGIYRRALLQISNGWGEITPFYFQKCWPMHRITWFSYAIRARPLNIKGYFGIIVHAHTGRFTIYDLQVSYLPPLNFAVTFYHKS
jgi:hypothetical protein